MNIRRNGEDGIFLESETARMYIGNNSVGEYVISIAKNATGRREILIPKVIMMDKKDEVIYEAFLEFMKECLGIVYFTENIVVII